MSSQIVPSFASPPRKKGSKKGKRRSSNDNDGSRSAKAQHVKGPTSASSKFVDTEDRDDEPRRSGRNGAGSGGRNQQLEKIGAVLEDRTVKPHMTTDFPEGVISNPLAPPMKSVKLGRRGVSKKDAPPPYAPADLSQVQATPVPIFHQRASELDRFGFNAPARMSQPAHIVPPGTFPLQPASSRTHGDRSAVGPPRPVSSRTFENQSIDPAVPGDSLPSHKASSRTHGDRSVDPARKASVSSKSLDGPASLGGLLPSHRASQQFANHCRETQVAEDTRSDSDSTESSSEGEKASARSDAPDEGDEDGWGATRSRQVAHPGFSKEFQPNSPVRHIALPTDHEFQFSRDEDDDIAQLNLDNAKSQHSDASDMSNHRDQVDVTRSVHNAESQHGDAAEPQAQHGNAIDVLHRHHQVNGRPSAPDPRALASPQESARTRAPRNSKKARDAGPSPKNLGFYPSVWKDCLEEAKRECRASHLLSHNPFPSKSRDLKTSITDALTTTIADWNDGGAVFEPGEFLGSIYYLIIDSSIGIGYWPDNKVNMACVLLGDMSTWRSELKNTAFAVSLVAYNLIPPHNIAMLRDKAQWVQNAAAELLTDSLFLRGGFDELGKTNNFSHAALKEATIKFFYTGSYRIADKRPNQFRKSVPFACIALVGAALNCVLDGFVKNGTATLKTVPQFSGKEYRATFQAIIKMLNETLRHPYHGQKLQKQLGNWGEEGWAALHEVDAGVERDNHLQLFLD